jgi:hypothetical protein
MPVGDDDEGEDLAGVGLTTDIVEVVTDREMEVGVEAAFVTAVVLAVKVVHT